MLRKIITLLVAFGLLFALAACTSNEDLPGHNNSESETVKENSTNAPESTATTRGNANSTTVSALASDPTTSVLLAENTTTAVEKNASTVIRKIPSMKKEKIDRKAIEKAIKILYPNYDSKDYRMEVINKVPNESSESRFLVTFTKYIGDTQTKSGIVANFVDDKCVSIEGNVSYVSPEKIPAKKDISREQEETYKKSALDQFNRDNNGKGYELIEINGTKFYDEKTGETSYVVGIVYNSQDVQGARAYTFVL